MLTLKETRVSIWLFHIYSLLNFLPLEVDVNRGQIKLTKSSRRWKIWKFGLIIVLFQWLFLLIRLQQSLLFPKRHLDISQLPIHLMLILIASLTIFWLSSALLLKPDLTITLFNDLVITTTPEAEGEAEEKPQWKNLTKQQIYAISLPFINIASPFVYVFLHIHDPTGKYFVYSILSQEWQSPWILILLSFYECFIITFYCNLSLIGFIMLLFFENCNEKIQRGIRRLSRISGYWVRQGSTKVNGWQLIIERRNKTRDSIIFLACEDSRQLQLLIQMFNEAFAYDVCSAKILSLTGSIAFTAFAIRLCHTDIFMSVFYGVFGIIFTIGFSVIYERAFVIPVGLKKYKKCIVNASNLIGAFQIDPNRRNEFIKTAASIQNCGIRVGDFHHLEKSSTPKFISFVTRYIAKLFIAFR